jgi:hypothetical protein
MPRDDISSTNYGISPTFDPNATLSVVQDGTGCDSPLAIIRDNNTKASIVDGTRDIVSGVLTAVEFHR